MFGIICTVTIFIVAMVFMASLWDREILRASTYAIVASLYIVFATVGTSYILDGVPREKVLSSPVVRKEVKTIQCKINSDCQVNVQCNCRSVCTTNMISTGNGVMVPVTNCSPSCDRCPVYEWEKDYSVVVDLKTELRSVQLYRSDDRGAATPRQWESIVEGQALDVDPSVVKSTKKPLPAGVLFLLWCSLLMLSAAWVPIDRRLFE